MLEERQNEQRGNNQRELDFIIIHDEKSLSCCPCSKHIVLAILQFGRSFSTPERERP